MTVAVFTSRHQSRLIDFQTFAEWANSHYHTYASDKVNDKPLRFFTNSNGGFIVTYDGDEMYWGFSFDEAAKIYNGCLWRQS